MKVYTEMNLRDFKPWSGAISRFETLTESQLDTLECILEDVYEGEALEDTTINDILWFEEDTMAEWLGFDSWEDLEKSNNGEDDEDEEEDEDDEL